MMEDFVAVCPCGHVMAVHDVDEYPGDGTETCCVEGCAQIGCPGKRDPAPSGQCGIPAHADRFRLITGYYGPDGHDAEYLICLDCDRVPDFGHPHKEPGWSRRATE